MKCNGEYKIKKKEMEIRCLLNMVKVGNEQDKFIYKVSWPPEIDADQQNGKWTEGDYICPLSLTSYTQQEVNTDAITIEHAPQNALGGHEKALTNKECNNRARSEIDCHLVKLVQKIEFRRQEEGFQREGSFEVSGQRIHGSLIYHNGNCELRLPIRSNDTRINLGGIMTVGEEFEFEGKRVRYNANCAMAAMLKNAYILLFARIGYPVLASAHYNLLRKFINNPYRYFLPKALCRIDPTAQVNDGIYLFQKADVKGF